MMMKSRYDCFSCSVLVSVKNPIKKFQQEKGKFECQYCQKEFNQVAGRNKHEKFSCNLSPHYSKVKSVDNSEENKIPDDTEQVQKYSIHK